LNQCRREGFDYGVERDFQQYFSYIVAVSFIGGYVLAPPLLRYSLSVVWRFISITFYHIVMDVRVPVLNATFSNISAISWRFISGGNLRKPQTCRQSQTSFIT
jgi:hypothetical protein